MAGFGTELVWWCPTLDREGSQTTTLNDLVAAYDATLTNMDPANDWLLDNGSNGLIALDLDGVDDRCVNATEPPRQSTGAVGVWIKCTVGRCIFSAWSVSSSSRFLNVYATVDTETAGKIKFRYRNGVASSIENFDSNAVPGLMDGNWHFVVLAADGTDYFVWVDHVAVAINNVSSSALSGRWLGSLDVCDVAELGSASGSASFFEGRLDDFRLLSSLSDAQRAEWYAGGRGYTIDTDAATPRILSPHLIGDVG